MSKGSDTPVEEEIRCKILVHESHSKLKTTVHMDVDERSPLDGRVQNK